MDNQPTPDEQADNEQMMKDIIEVANKYRDREDIHGQSLHTVLMTVLAHLTVGAIPLLALKSIGDAEMLAQAVAKKLGPKRTKELEDEALKEEIKGEHPVDSMLRSIEEAASKLPNDQPKYPAVTEEEIRGIEEMLAGLTPDDLDYDGDEEK